MDTVILSRGTENVSVLAFIEPPCNVISHKAPVTWVVVGIRTDCRVKDEAGDAGVVEVVFVAGGCFKV